jgi:protein gp37
MSTLFYHLEVFELGKETAISWCDHTLNSWWGCVEVSPGCDHCYAKTLAERWGRQVWGVLAPRYFTKKGFNQALAWDAAAKKDGVRRRVFVQSMSDICEILPEAHESKAEMDARRKDLFERIIPTCSNLDFQLLTKRVGNYSKVVPASWMSGEWPSNAWAGISVVNQNEVDRDIPKLERLPAPVRFLSVEPLISDVLLDDHLLHLHWVIIGGESGSQARSMVLGWAKDIVRECAKWNVAVFMKQLGKIPINREGVKHPISDSHGANIEEFPAILRVRQFPGDL